MGGFCKNSYKRLYTVYLQSGLLNSILDLHILGLQSILYTVYKT